MALMVYLFLSFHFQRHLDLGRKDISLHPPEAGKETRGNAGKPAGAELEVAGLEGKQLGAVSDVGH